MDEVFLLTDHECEDGVVAAIWRYQARGDHGGKLEVRYIRGHVGGPVWVIACFDDGGAFLDSLYNKGRRKRQCSVDEQ